MNRLGIVALCLVVLGLSGSAFAQQPEEPVIQGKPLKHWIAALQDNDTARRIEAAEIVAQFGPQAKPAVPALAKALSDPEEWVRRQTINTLASLGPDAVPALPAVRPLLLDPSVRVRVAAAQLLGRLDPRTGEPATVLNDALMICCNDLIVRYSAAQVIQELGPRGAGGVEGLICALGDPDGNLPSQASYALSAVGPDALPQLVPALLRKDQPNRGLAAQAIANAINMAADLEQQQPPPMNSVGPDLEDQERYKKQQFDAERLRQERIRKNRGLLAPVLPDLVKMLSDPDESVRNSVAGVLHRLGPPAAKALVPELKNADVRARVLAAQALGRLDSQTLSAAPVLAAVLKDKENEQPLRLLAAQTLAEQGPRSLAAVPVLLEALHEPDLSPTAAQALASLGADSLPPLMAALRNDNLAVRQPVASAIYNICSNLTRPGDSSGDIDPFGLAPPPPPDKKAQAEAQRIRQEKIKKECAVVEKVTPDLIRALADEDEQVRSNITSALAVTGAPVVPALLKALDAGEARVRFGAAVALTQMGLPDSERARVRKALVRLKNDPDAQVRAVVEPALATPLPSAKPMPVATTLEGLSEQLQGKDENLRNSAAHALAAKKEQALPVIRDALKHKDVGVRRYAIVALSAMSPRPEPAIQVLIEAMKDDDHNLRHYAISVLSNSGAAAKPAVGALAKALSDPSAQVRVQSAYTLTMLGSDAKPAMADLIKAVDDEACREHALNALVNLGREAAEAIRPMLTDPDARKRTQAVNALSRMGSNAQPAAPALAKMLHDRRMSLRLLSSQVLLNLGPLPAESIPDVVAALDDDPDLYHRAIQLLSSAGPAVAKPMAEALNSDSAQVRQGAFAVLQNLGPRAKDAVPQLKTTVENGKDKARRVQALQLLSALGAEAKPAIPAMVAVLEKDTDGDVRQQALVTLHQLGPEAGEALPTVVKVLQNHKEVNARQQAAQALGRFTNDRKEAFAALTVAVEKDPDAGVRLLALASAGQLGLEGKVVLPLIVRALEKDADGNVRSHAAQMLGQVGPEAKELVPALVQLLKHPRNEVRGLAITGLAGIGPDARPALEPMLALLPTAEPSLYEGLVNALARQGAAAAPDLAKALASENARVREAALRALAQMAAEAKPALPHLDKALRDPNPRVRQAALQIVVTLGADAKETLPGVMACLKDADETTGQAAIGAAVALRPHSVVPLTKELRHANGRVRFRALAALGQVGEHAQPALPAILDKIVDPDVNVRAQALSMLHAIPWQDTERPATLARIQEAINDRDPQVRALAASLLPRFGTDAVHILIPALQSADPNVRREAAVALAQFNQTRAGVPALTAALKDPDARVRTQAAISLWQIDQQRQATVPVLVAAAMDPDSATRREAMKGLIAMEGFPLIQPRISG